EAGEKGCYYVKLNKHHVEMQFVPLQSVLFEEVTCDVSTCESIYEMEAVLKESLAHLEGKVLVHVTFFSDNNSLLAYETDGRLADLLLGINEQSLGEDEWLYLYTHRLEVAAEKQFARDDL